MKKLSIILISTFAFSSNIKYALHSNHAFTMPEGKKIFIFEYQKSNKTLDIFHLRDDDISKTFGGVGDLDGIKLKTYYGIKNNFTSIGEFQFQKIEYGDGNLKNFFLKLDAKKLLFTNLDKTNAFSVDIGIKINKAQDITYDNPKYLETLAKKFLNVKNVTILNNKIGVVKNDGTTEILNLKSPPSITISNMKDFTPFINFTVEKEFQYAFFSVFTGISYTKIYTDIKANINPADESTKEKISKYNLSKNLDRDEKTLNIGFNITTKTPIIMELSYQYLRIFRDKDLDYINYNHIIDLDFIKPINDNIFIYLGGKLLYRQFNGVIPYLYNKYSQTTFDHKYGWARVGIGYCF